MGEYNQDCRFGFLRGIEDNDSDDVKGSAINKMVVECHNPSCPDKFCKYGYYTGELVSDEECVFFVKFKR